MIQMLNLLQKTEFIEDTNFFDDVKTLINLLGYKFIISDDDLFYVIASREIERLNNDCNTTLIAEGLREFLKERIVGAFYGFKISVNGLGEDFAFSDAVKQIQLGDASYTFKDGASDKDMFNFYISKLQQGDDYLCYRKLKW